ncbi:Sister chromatid cohesion 1 protein 4 [Bienertia sinuspersici]
MFYSQFILAKKGPLGTIWIAAHLERKLRKNQVADTDIGVSVDSILFPEVPIALRLSSHLLLGVVRIYSKKVNYLFDDCSDALLKVKQAFRSTAVDLPPEQSKAPYHSITLPETFDLDDFELPDNEVFQGNFVDHHVSTREQITLQDTMDGVAFSTSQFGPDERFGDGDASQIGLDLDEELFMDKGDAAGTSGISVDTDARSQMSPRGSSPFKGDEHNEGILDPPLASNTNYFTIQAPSTPGLTEEPNLPSTKEEIQVSDDHMDEDQIPCELAAKEVSGTTPSPARPDFMEEPNLPSTKEEIQVSDDHMDEDQNPCELAAKEVSGTTSSPARPCSELHLGRNVPFSAEQDTGEVKTLKTESLEFISSGFAQPATSNEHIEASDGQDNMGNIRNTSILENKEFIAAEMQSKECCDVEEVNMNGTVLPVAETAIIMEVEEVGLNKTDLNGNYHPLDSEAENDKLSAAPAALGLIDVLTSGSENQNSFQSCVNPNTDEISESNIKEKSSDFVTPFLQVCTSKVPSTCDGADNVLDLSILPTTQEDGLSSVGMPGRDNAIDVSELPTNVRADAVELTSQADQTAYGANCAVDSNLRGQLDNLVADENHSEKENNLRSSDFPPPEVLLSMPNLSAGLSENFLFNSTPSKEVLATNGDATDENIISGRKRSFTESTLTVQSLNSVESSGGAQSKGTVESIPDDNDLLSSILAGKRSTSFKMKPSPPVPGKVHAKRQRTAVRSVPHKRKVLVDDSTVLHGDTIRQQLTNTEDIRRVRKKAPCTDLEVWLVQKQILEDDIFSEPVFAGMFPALRNEISDLNGIRIIQDNGTTEATVADKSAKPTLVEETEGVESLVPPIAGVSEILKLDDKVEENGTKGATEADKSAKPTLVEETEGVESLIPPIAGVVESLKLDEKVEAVGTLVPSIAVDEGLIVCGGSLSATPCQLESTISKEIGNLDNVVTKQMSQYDASKENLEMGFDDKRIPIGDEAVHTAASVSEPIPSVDFPPVVCNSTDDTKVDSVNKSSDVMMPMIIDNTSGQLLDQRCVTHSSVGDASTVDDASGSGIQDQGVDIVVPNNFDLDGRSDGKHLLDKSEGVDIVLPNKFDLEHFQDAGSLPVDDNSLSDSMALEDRACPKSDHVVENCHPVEFGVTNKEETSCTGLGHDGSCLTSNNVDEHVTLDSPYSVEAKVSSQITDVNETEGLHHSEADPEMLMDSTSVPTEITDAGNNAESGADVIEHDTDFLNVDDDDVAEDYESDTPDHEEKCILDNSGWSARTRAVANYLQALFEKESDEMKKVISLDSLLVGKSRKEASRMFFETLVLKTKDYVHAEQDSTFRDIKITPRGKLMKPGF